jgi:hypothetical protein
MVGGVTSSRKASSNILTIRLLGASPVSIGVRRYTRRRMCSTRERRGRCQPCARRPAGPAGVGGPAPGLPRRQSPLHVLSAWCSVSVRMRAFIIAYVIGRVRQEARQRKVVGDVYCDPIGQKVTRLYSRATYVIPSPLAPCYPSAGRSCLGLSGLQASCHLGSRHPLLLVRYLHRVGGHACARLTTCTITILSTASEVGGLVVSSTARPHARRPKPGA